jgi:NAD(P)-dependent dehydrogenase (short-subunit alcohol dehydrogenase family)
MGRLRDKVAFVTGGASGIGRATVKLFATEGARVVILDIAEAGGASCAAEIADAGGSAVFIRTDVSSEESVAAAFEAGLARFGRIDVLHNNAGGSTGRDGSLVDVPVEELWRVMRLDLLGTILTCRNAIPRMREQGRGSIVNMSSVVSLIGVADVDFYTAAKGAVSALTRTLALQHGPSGVRVNAIAPGVTMTERILARSGGDVSNFPLSRKQFLGPAQPLDIANAALFLASDEAAKITGQVLPVDGGASAW